MKNTFPRLQLVVSIAFAVVSGQALAAGRASKSPAGEAVTARPSPTDNPHLPNESGDRPSKALGFVEAIGGGLVIYGSAVAAIADASLSTHSDTRPTIIFFSGLLVGSALAAHGMWSIRRSGEFGPNPWPTRPKQVVAPIAIPTENGLATGVAWSTVLD